MSDTLVGRGLYPFVGASTDASSPTSDPTASTWASKPIPGQRAFETDTLFVYEFDSLTWVKIRGTDSSGNPAANIVAEIQMGVGVLETRLFTIDDAADCFTDKTAPLIAELLTADTFTAGKKRCRITLHTQHTNAAVGVPDAAAVVCTLNSPDDTTAVQRLTYVDVGAGGTGSVDTGQRMLSVQNPVVEYDLTKTSSQVTRVDMGGYLPVGIGTLPIYISVEVW